MELLAILATPILISIMFIILAGSGLNEVADEIIEWFNPERKSRRSKRSKKP